MLYIYTLEYRIVGKLKAWVKQILGRDFGGPKMVMESLLHGFNELGQEYLLNTAPKKPGVVAGVLNGAEVLMWAIKQKQLGKIQRIVAGPNIVILPSHENGILRNSAIDAILVPSNWVKESYVKDSPELAEKIFVWPAGIYIPEMGNESKDIDFLIYNKVGETKLIEEIRTRVKGCKVKELTYGNFKQADYFSWLNRTKYLVYVSESESQGLAMFEAWARNVPVLAWERGYAVAGEVTVEGKTSAPYMHVRAGRSFSNASDLGKIIESLSQLSFDPRAYILEYFSPEVCAKNYLAIINNA